MKGYERRADDLEAGVEELAPERFANVLFICEHHEYGKAKTCACPPEEGDVTVVVPIRDERVLAGPPPPPPPEVIAALRGTVDEVGRELARLGYFKRGRL